MLQRGMIWHVAMVWAVALAALGLSESAGVRGGDGREEPWFCHGIECPAFDRLPGGSSGYSLRHYAAAEWVTTVVKVDTLSGFRAAENEGFMRLFKYISGANAEKAKIEMTAPVLQKITVGQGPFCGNGLEMSFYVPKKFQGKAPKPTATNVYIQTIPEATYYVREFSTPPPGPDASRVIAEAEKMVNDLQRSRRHNFQSDTYFHAAYDPPFRLIGRHDEVWFKLNASANVAQNPQIHPAPMKRAK